MKATRFQIILAFAALYLIWGSTYLAIRFVNDSMPTFLTAGLRFLISGAILYGYCFLRDRSFRPTLKQWRNAGIIGVLLLLGGNGEVVWAEHYIPSGLAALFIAATPWWMVLMEWLYLKTKRPNVWTFLGLILGFVGVAVLVAPAFSGHIHLVGALVLLSASFWWACGSIYSRKADLPVSPLAATSMEMLVGGAALILFGMIQGEAAAIHWQQMTLKSALAFFYLIGFGSLVGFTSYIWLLSHVRPGLVSTYAFVNPMVAVFLGWALAGETLTLHTMVAAIVIVAAVVLITFGQTLKIEEPPC